MSQELMQAVHQMFVLDTGVTVLEKIARAILVYFFLMIGLRIAGKRELAQLNPFDLIVLLMLSNTVQNAVIGADNSVIGGMIGAIALLGTNWALVRFSRRNRHLQRLLEGRPEILIRDGQLLRDHMAREMITRGELMSAAHRQGIASLHDVERCVLEPTGNLCFIERRPNTEAARHDEIMQQLKAIAAELSTSARVPSPDV